MSSTQSIHLTLDRRLLRHPRAYHLRRMRIGIWLYLDLLARLPVGAGTLEIEPVVVAGEMGVEEGFVRSWLGHLRAAGYVDVERLNGHLRVGIKHGVHLPTPIVDRSTPKAGGVSRFFTAQKLEDALGERDQPEALQAALNLHPDPVIRRALAGSLAVPRGQIRKSRTALFLYLLKRYAHETTN